MDVAVARLTVLRPASAQRSRRSSPAQRSDTPRSAVVAPPSCCAQAGYLTAGFTGGGYYGEQLRLLARFRHVLRVRHSRSCRRALAHRIGSTAGRCSRAPTPGCGIAAVHRSSCSFTPMTSTTAARSAMPDQSASEPWSAAAGPRRQPLLRFYDDLIASTDGLIGRLVAELAQLGFGRQHADHRHGGSRRVLRRARLSRARLRSQSRTRVGAGAAGHPVSARDPSARRDQ